MDCEFCHIDCHNSVTTADMNPEFVSVDTTYTARPYLLNSSYELNKDKEKKESVDSSLPTATPTPLGEKIRNFPSGTKSRSTRAASHPGQRNRCHTDAASVSSRANRRRTIVTSVSSGISDSFISAT